MLKNIKSLKKKLNLNLNQVIAALVTLLSIGAIFMAFMTFHIDQYIEVLELKTYDLRAANRLIPSPNRPSNDIIILAFDDLTLNTYGDEYGTWPWPRQIHGDMIQFFNDVADTKMIIYDLMFSTPQKFMEESDKALTDAFQKYDNIYVSMNFDHNADVMAQIGKYDSRNLDVIKPLSISVDSKLAKSDDKSNLNQIGFFEGGNINFEHFRPLLSGLMEAKKNIGFVNHETDLDGISRGNPLIYRLDTNPPIKTTALPIKHTKGTEGNIIKSVDAEGHLVNEFGYLLNENGETKTQNYHAFFPYLSFRAFLDNNYGKNTPDITINANGNLTFDNKTIPLLPNGMFLINWYNVDYQKEIASQFLIHTNQRINQLQQDSSIPADEKNNLIRQAREEISRYQKIMDRPFKSTPYNTISAWEVLKTMRNYKKGSLDNRDKQLINYLKNKIVFVGATAVATYDTKYTPLHPLGTQGVLIPITIFDNLRQGDHLMSRLNPNWNLLITIVLCVLCALAALKLRSATAGMLSVFALGMLYAITATVIFKQMNLWINLAMPLVAILITTLLTFMMKYISRDQDYEKTYIMATTDSMTGLYNHRFFQEHMQKSIERSDRFGQKFSLVLIDIDFFKKFNDNYGHQAGDEVLRCVAKKLEECVRTIDVVARYGGEEMAVVLDRANEEEALAVAEKLVKEVAAEAYPISEDVKKHVTISVGVSTYPTHGKTPTELIEFSDQGLYRAKESGRNQVGAQYDEDMPAKAEESNETPASGGH